MQSHRPEELEHRFGSKADFMRYMSESCEFFFPLIFKIKPIQYNTMCHLNPWSTKTSLGMSWLKGRS
jgi:hypothetical protein